MDWPGLDRWGTSEEGALGQAGDHVRAMPTSPSGPAWRAFARARDVEVVERVPGSSSTDFWGVAHVPSGIEREVLSPAELERRLDLLRACWAYFDDIAARVSAELRPGPRSAGRSRDQIIRHVLLNEPGSFRARSRSGRRSRYVVTPEGLAAHGSSTSMASAPTTSRASRRGAGRSSSSFAGPPTTSWITPGRWRTGRQSRPLMARQSAAYHRFPRCGTNEQDVARTWCEFSPGRESAARTSSFRLHSPFSSSLVPWDGIHGRSATKVAYRRAMDRWRRMLLHRG